MRILAVETSCDETAAAVVESGPTVVSNIIYSQFAAHEKFGGVVPEIASRFHLTKLVEVVEAALEPAGGWDAIDGLAVTRGPGLIGALLVGLQFIKGAALARGLPWIGVNHLEGHLCASLLADEKPPFPHVALIVSGGHTHIYRVENFGRYELLGATRDDAAGEAFDKSAKLLGLGYPGGVAIDRTSQGGDASAFDLPRALPAAKDWDFSFSGLKTAVHRVISERSDGFSEAELRDFCASLQMAIADVLTKKTLRAATALGIGHVVVGGGVAANSLLRALFHERGQAAGIRVHLPEGKLCTDNAAMIGAAGLIRLERGEHDAFSVGAQSRWPLGEAA